VTPSRGIQTAIDSLANINRTFRQTNDREIVVCPLVVYCVPYSFTANAELLSRLGGLACYDNDSDLTWLSDANAAGTTSNWHEAKRRRNINGVTKRRLPVTLQPDPTYGIRKSLIHGLKNVLNRGNNITAVHSALWSKPLAGEITNDVTVSTNQWSDPVDSLNVYAFTGSSTPFNR
jgi:hypothetical protein